MIAQANGHLLEFIPSILKFGITGLSAIAFVLAFYLLRDQNKKDKPSAPMLKTIKSFMWIALVFAFLSAISSFAEGYFINKSITADEAQNIRKETLVEIATNSIASEMDLIAYRHTYENGFVAKGRGIDPTNPSQKIQEMSEDDFKLKVLRQAVFSCVRYFGADGDILKEALLRIEKRGIDFGSSDDKLLQELNDLVGLRYKWLKDGAIKNAQQQIDNFPQQVQEEPNATIVLPKQVWVFSSYEEDNEPSVVIDYSELDSYKSELELLKQKIK